MSVHEVPVSIEVDGYERQAPPIEEALFRIAQEAVNNAVKHARAKRVRIALSAGGATVRLTVVDDGVGFDPARDIRAGGLGLTSMRERASALGGRIRIETSPGAGTRVEVTVPLAEVTSP
jgi:signal transduction histidine kinase